MSSLPFPPQFAAQVLRGLLAFSYTDIASASALSYDYLITLPSEIRYIWNGPRSLASLLFFVTRYPPFVDTVILLTHSLAPSSIPTYRILYRAQVGSYGIGLLVSSAILILRTSAIWNKARRVTIGLSALLICIAIAAGYTSVDYLSGLQFVESPFPSSPGCFVQNNKNNLYIPYALVMGFETVILVLTLVKASGPKDTSPLHLTLYRDSLRFYVYLFAISAANTVVLATATQELRPILTSPHRVLHSVLSGRLILNIYEAADKSHCRDSCNSECQCSKSSDSSCYFGDSSARISFPVWTNYEGEEE